MSGAADSNAELERIRAEIDRIDLQLQTLLNERAACAGRVAEVKKQDLLRQQAAGAGDQSSGTPVSYYRPEREALVLRRVMERNAGPLPAIEVAHIFREIMSACLALERVMTIAYLGPDGTFTQAAAIKHFGHAVTSRPLATIAAVFDEVESRDADFGVVPVENSTEGMVTHTLDNFINSSLKICGEVEMPIRLHLLIAPGSDASKMSRICAHQQALAQCRSWLDKHWPHLERVATSSNGEAARMAAADITAAAVAGDIAAETYGLVRLSSNIQDYADNTTRFLVIGHDQVRPSGRDKTSIIVSTHNKPGALFHLLEPFQREQLMLTRIDTRPSRSETWTYLFFVEFEGHQQDERVARVLHELEEQTVMLKILGSYPQAVI
jgi:chorismate mutase / prephenate dehydratase